MQIHNSDREPTLASRQKLFAGVVGYMLAILFPAMVATIANGKLLAAGILDSGVAVSGIVAYSIVSMQFVLAARFSWIDKNFGFPAVLRLHKSMAVLATLLALVHIMFLVLSRGNWDVVLNPWASWAIQLGRVVVFALFVILAISFGRRWIPINHSDWLWFHNALALSILVLGFVHSVALGTGVENPIFAAVWIGYFGMAILAWAWRRDFFGNRAPPS